MAVVITREIRKKRIMLAVSGGLVVVSALIVYFGVFYQGGSMVPAGETQVQKTQTTVADVNIDIFEDSRFKILKPSPGVPIATDTPGKANPFSD